MKRLANKVFKKLTNHDEQLFAIGCAYLNLMRSKYSDIQALTEVEYKVFSQWGEDGIIDYLLSSIGVSKPKFIEIGTEDYKESNTRFLFERTQCQGLIVDCDPQLNEKVKSWLSTWKGDLTAVSSFVSKSNIRSILQSANYEDNVDLFSLDIDGVDYWVLKELPEKFAKVVVVEFNPIFGPDLEITVPYQDTFFRTDYHYSNLCWGASLTAFISLLNDKGFTFVGTNLNCSNAFFVENSFTDCLNLDFSLTTNRATFTNNFMRESRNKDGSLSYLSGKDRLKEISNCKVVDLSKNPHQKVSLSQIISD